MALSSFRQKINIKFFMVGYLSLLLVYSSIYFHNFTALWKGLLIILLYAGFDLIWTYQRDKVWYFPLSSIISGLILSLVAIPNPRLILIIILPLIAVFSKQLFHFGKKRHVFNPAAFSMAIVSLFIPTATWWGSAGSHMPKKLSEITQPNAGTILFFILILGGLFILWRQKRWHVTIPFFISYAFFLALLSLSQGIALQNLLIALKSQLLNGVTIFFASVMLIEPMTSTFGRWRYEITYGAIVGGMVVLIIYMAQQLHWSKLDPLVYGLIIGNLIASLLFLPEKSPPVPNGRIQGISAPPIWAI